MSDIFITCTRQNRNFVDQLIECQESEGYSV
jgi:hypothetical protein